VGAPTRIFKLWERRVDDHEDVIELVRLAEDAGEGWVRRNMYESAIRKLVHLYAGAMEDCGTEPENIAEALHDMTQIGG